MGPLVFTSDGTNPTAAHSVGKKSTLLTGTLQVLLNDAGGFSPGWSVTEAVGSLTEPWDLDLADTDGDGDLDLLYVVPSGGPAMRSNDGRGQFDEMVYLPAFALRAHQEPADVDGDGDIDIVYLEEDIIPYFGTLEGDGTGDFQFNLFTEIYSGLGWFDLQRRFELADMDDDGLLDTLLAGKSGLKFIRGRPPTFGDMPGWDNPVPILDLPCLDVVLVDLDGDGRLDVVTSVPSQQGVVVLLTQPSGTLGPPRVFAAGPVPDALAAADLDLDGHADIIVTDPRSQTVSVLRGKGDGTLHLPQDIAVDRRPSDVVAADFDQDGDIDLAVACAGASSVSLLVNTTR